MNSTSPIFKTFFYLLAFGGRSPLLDSIESASSNYSSLIFSDKELPGTSLNKVDCPAMKKTPRNLSQLLSPLVVLPQLGAASYKTGFTTTTLLRTQSSLFALVITLSDGKELWGLSEPFSIVSKEGVSSLREPRPLWRQTGRRKISAAVKELLWGSGPTQTHNTYKKTNIKVLISGIKTTVNT